MDNKENLNVHKEKKNKNTYANMSSFECIKERSLLVTLSSKSSVPDYLEHQRLSRASVVPDLENYIHVCLCK